MGSREDDAYWDEKYAEEWFNDNDENIVLDEELDDETLEGEDG